jgi:hypothetical protein
LIRVIVPRAKGPLPFKRDHPCREEVKTGQYPTENEAREKFQLTVNRWLEIIADKKEAAN